MRGPRCALALDVPEGYVRTFVDEGAPMSALLKQLLKDGRTQQRPAGPEPGVSASYVGKLLAALADDAASPASGHPHGPPVELLSERELEVLSLLDSDLSNREIAATLYVSLDTVKSHLKHVYGKLGARSRQGAVARARELGLL